MLKPLLHPRSLANDKSGIAVVEFAFAAPVFLALLMAVFDLGFAIYTRSVLQGAVEEGARSASLENTQWTDIETKVNDQVRRVIPVGDPSTDISFSIDPSYYQNYNDINMPEDFTDSNGNSEWDATECFVDRNGNASYDTDVGVAGRGGAQDVVSINASVTYKRIFPLWGLFGLPDSQTISAATFLRNQPFSAQAARSGVRICP